MAFVDFKKVPDKVNRGKVLEVLDAVPKQTIKKKYVIYYRNVILVTTENIQGGK
jgi:hypothetical protein